MDKAQVISEYFASLGAKKSRRKTASSRKTIKLAVAAKTAPVERMEKAYEAVKSGKMLPSAAAVKVAKCRYKNLLRYIARRDAGESMQEIKEAR